MSEGVGIILCPFCHQVNMQQTTIKEGDDKKGYFITMECPYCYKTLIIYILK